MVEVKLDENIDLLEHKVCILYKALLEKAIL